MDRIIISSSSKSVRLPRSRKFDVTWEEESKEYTVASGKLVKDVLGYRKVLKYSADWFPNDDLKTLGEMIASGDYLSVEYPDPIYGDDEDIFSIDPPNPRVFVYKNDAPMWRDIALSMKSQEVFLHADD